MSARSRAYPWFSDEPHRARPLVPAPVEWLKFTPLPEQPETSWLFGLPVVFGEFIDKRTGLAPLDDISFHPPRARL